MNGKKLSAFMTVCLIAGLFAGLYGCGSAPAAPEQTADTGTAAAESEPLPETETNQPAETSSLPDSYDLEGYNFRLIKQRLDKIAWSLNLFGVSEANGEILNDAFYERNLLVGSQYHFSITETEIDSSPVETVKKSVLAGDDEYDAALIAMANEKNAGSGIYYNLYDLPNLDLERSWWNRQLIDDLTIRGTLYFISGDIIVSEDDGLMINIYNKEMGADYTSENLYDAVRSGKWTYGKKLELMKLVSADLDNNGVYDTDDRLGVLYADNALAQTSYTSANVRLFTRSGDAADFTADSERAFALFETIQTIYSDPAVSRDWSTIPDSSRKIIEMLDGKRLLFLDVGIHFLRRNLRDLETDFSILPLPKLEETQDAYYNSYNLAMTHMLIPASVGNPDKTGFVLEALASASGNITDTYYKMCIEGKYVRDAESIEMLTLASRNIVFDFGFIYDWGGLKGKLTSALMGDQPYASLLEAGKSKAIAEMEKFFE